MKNLIASVITGTVLSLGFVGAGPAPIAQAAQVHKPNAKPGQFCAKKHHGDWTKTKKYGKLKCVRYASGKWHWKRA